MSSVGCPRPALCSPWGPLPQPPDIPSLPAHTLSSTHLRAILELASCTDHLLDTIVQSLPITQHRIPSSGVAPGPANSLHASSSLPLVHHAQPQRPPCSCSHTLASRQHLQVSRNSRHCGLNDSYSFSCLFLYLIDKGC